MRLASGKPPIASKSGGAETYGRSRNSLRHDDQIISVCRAIYPIKAAQHIADLTGYPLRTVEYIFAGGKMPADMLAILIKSEHGVRFVAALMVDASPPWWTRLRSYLTTLDAMRLHRAAQRKLQEAIDAEREVSESIELSTRILSGEDVYCKPASSVRQVAIAPGRAVARK